MKITRYTNLALFKSKDAPEKANDKNPYYDLSAKENKDSQTKVYPGKFWFKQSEAGLNFFSGSMAEARTWEGKTYEGYVIVSVKELDALEAKVNTEPVEAPATIVNVGGIDMRDFGTGKADEASIPF